MDRSCCHPFDGSAACPAGADFQVDDRGSSEGYIIYYTRCQSDHCNNGKGDNSDDADNGGTK